jgi:hypothetical protein
MRDDRYKRAPAPSCWRKFMKALFQAADRQHPERLSTLLSAALGKTLRENFDAQCRAALRCEDPILPGVGLPLGFVASPLASDLDARIRTLPWELANNPAHVRGELEQALMDDVSRWKREIGAHLLAERADDFSQIMASLTEAAACACSKAASDFLDQRTNSGITPIDLDENLLSAARRAA